MATPKTVATEYRKVLTFQHAERCQSGRMGRSRKPLYPRGYRGFESHPLRQPVRSPGPVTPSSQRTSVNLMGCAPIERLCLPVLVRNETIKGKFFDLSLFGFLTVTPSGKIRIFDPVLSPEFSVTSSIANSVAKWHCDYRKIFFTEVNQAENEHAFTVVFSTYYSLFHPLYIFTPSSTLSSILACPRGLLPFTGFKRLVRYCGRLDDEKNGPNGLPNTVKSP